MMDPRAYLASVMQRVRPLPSARVPLALAGGRVLAEPIDSRHGIPLFDNSAMDGYAVHRDDLLIASPGHPVTLRVVADLPAGFAEDVPLLPGTAARIMTGAPVPSGADAIVPVEDTDGGTQTVAIERCPKPGAHVRRQGEDSAIGARLLDPGVRLTPRALSAIAASGHGDAVVAAIPRVVVIATGSELVSPGLPLRRGEIPESNSLLLAGLARGAGAEVVDIVHVRDDPDALAAALTRTKADVIIISGGVSVGAYDVTKAVLAPMPGMTFTKVAMQPGKPQGSGSLDDGTLVFALPGNPVSACVSFELFVKPAIAALQGERRNPPLRAVAGRAWTSPAGREQFVPVTITTRDDGTVMVMPVSDGGSASHFVGSLARAQGLARVAADRTGVAPGDVLDLIVMIG